MCQTTSIIARENAESVLAAANKIKVNSETLKSVNIITCKINTFK